MVIHGKQAKVYIGTPIEDVGNEESLKTQLESENDSTEYTGEIMDITLSDAEASADLENTFGGQFLVETPPDTVEADVTLRFRDIEIMEEMHPSETDDTSGMTLISGAETTGQRDRKAFLFEATNVDGETIYYLINRGLFTQMGEISLDSDGFAELSGNILSKVEDRYIQMDPGE